MSDRIDITFTPTLKEAQAAFRFQQGRMVRYLRRTPQMILTFITALGLACGAVMILSPLFLLNMPDDVVNHIMIGEVLVIAALILRRYLQIRTNKNYLQFIYEADAQGNIPQRNLLLTEQALTATTEHSEIRINWADQAAIYEDDQFIHIEPARGSFFFIPKRIASAEDMEKLKAFIQKKISENAGKSTPTV